MIQLLARPAIEEAEILALFADDPRWNTLQQYLQGCLEVIMAQLSIPTSPRDEDQMYKGMIVSLRHVLQIPKISKEVLQTKELEKKTEEAEDISLEEGGKK